jgi:ABC-type oligopeptide transport system substrate-binding subunit
MAGFRNAHAYPIEGPDLARAKRLADKGTRTAVLYSVDESSSLRRAHVLVTNLAAIGIRVEVHKFPYAVLLKKEARANEPFDIAESNWTPDGWFDPFYWLNDLFDSNLAHTADYWNLSHFDEPSYNRRLETAAQLTGAARYRAYARLDADLTRKASPIVVYASPSREDFFSARMGCQVHGPYGMDLAALCIRPHNKG